MIYLEDIERVKTKFKELGDEIFEASELTEEFEDAMISSLQDGVMSVISNVLTSEDFSKLSGTSDVADEYVDSLEALLKERMGEIDGSLTSVNQAISGMPDQFKSISEKLEGFGDLEGAQPSGGAPGGGEAPAEDPDAEEGDEKKPKTGLFGKELKNLKSKIGGLLAKFKVPKPGNVLAGGLMLLAYGYMEKDRMRAEAGEVKNIVMAAADSGISSIANKATSRVASLQENLQKTYGIARTEPQAVLSEFVNSGLALDDIMKRVDGSMKLVGRDFVTFTLGLDKMRNVAGGDSARQIVGIMADYGKELKDATEQYQKLYFVGRESGIGPEQFTKNIQASTDALKQFGFNMDDMIDIAVNLQEHFEAIGVPKQFAGRQAALGLQQVAQGLAGVSDSWKVILGEKMGYGKGLEARQKMMEGWTRIAEGDNREELVKLIGEAYGVALQASAGDETRARYMMESQMNLGFEGAQAAVTIGKLYKEGNIKEAYASMKKNSKILKSSFKTEAQKTSAFQRNMNQFMKGMSKVGQALLAIVTDSLAALIAYFGALPQLFSNFFDEDQGTEKNAALLNSLGQFTADMGKHVDKMVSGFKQSGGAVADIFGDIFPSVGKAFDFAKKAWSGGDVSGGTSSGVPIVQIVTVPVEKGGTYGFGTPSSVSEERGSGGDWGSKKWAGGQLSVVSEGVNARGDIQLSLTGNCPRCGLIYGRGGPVSSGDGDFSSMGLGDIGKHSGSDVEALARMGQSEAGGVKGGRKHLAGIMHTALNRARSSGKSLTEVITGGHGWGKQGKKRAYASRVKPGQKTIDFAKDLLSGKGMKDWTGGAKSFIHAKPGDEFKRGKKQGGSGAFPPFARNQAMTAQMNVGRGGKKAMFFKKGGTEAAPEKATRAAFDKAYQDKVDKRNKQTAAKAPKKVSQRQGMM